LQRLEHFGFAFGVKVRDTQFGLACADLFDQFGTAREGFEYLEIDGIYGLAQVFNLGVSHNFLSIKNFGYAEVKKSPELLVSSD
jgi:hypothetical protein